MADKEGKRWTVDFYTDHRGKAPAREFLRGLARGPRAAMYRVIGHLREFGPYLSLPEARHIRGKIWELRAGQGRVFYFAYVESRFIILSGYLKKTRRAPKSEIERAERFMRRYLEDNQ